MTAPGSRLPAPGSRHEERSSGARFSPSLPKVPDIFRTRPGERCLSGNKKRKRSGWCRDPCLGGESCGVERSEAEAILDGDRETAVGLLLRLDELVEANQRLVEANERLEGRVARARASAESEFAELVVAAVAGSSVGAAASGRERLRSASGVGRMGMKAGIGGCFHRSRSTRSSSIGLSGAGRVRMRSPKRIVSMRSSLLGVRSPSCRRSRSR